MNTRGLLVLGVFLAVGGSVWAAPVVIPLGDARDVDPDPYVVEVPELVITEHSTQMIIVENILDPLRWKEWRLTVRIPQGYAAPSLASLGYSISGAGLPDPPAWQGNNIPLAPDPGAPVHPDYPTYVAYYADTSEIDWYEYGTQPEGAGLGRVDLGNPMWVLWNIDFADVPTGIPTHVCFYDECVPEPATLILLGLGGLGLLRFRKR